MWRTGLTGLGAVALVAVLAAVAIHPGAGSHRTSPAQVPPNLAAMLQSELSGHPSMPGQAGHRVSGIRPRVVTPRLLPRSITGWSCPVAGGSPCGAKSHAEFMPLTVTGAQNLVRRAPALLGGSTLPQINISPSP